jgi:hypothetical protein
MVYTPPSTPFTRERAMYQLKFHANRQPLADLGSISGTLDVIFFIIML